MKKTKTVKSLFVLTFCFVLITAMALCTAGCKTNKNDGFTPSVPNPSAEKATALGEGKNNFDFSVTYKNGKTDYFKISTDKTNVGEALLELKLIAGDEGAYGLYVKTVNGVTLDFDKDKLYWAFYENGEYALSGVDKTEITSGSSYAFKAEK